MTDQIVNLVTALEDINLLAEAQQPQTLEEALSLIEELKTKAHKALVTNDRLLSIRYFVIYAVIDEYGQRADKAEPKVFSSRKEAEIFAEDYGYMGSKEGGAVCEVERHGLSFIAVTKNPVQFKT